jgi:hypothetical protein
MGSKHESGSQALLHETFPGFAELLVDRIAMVLDELAKRRFGRTLRVLDIGSGSIPYAKAFRRSSNLDVTLLDSDPGVTDNAVRRAAVVKRNVSSRFLRRDFFDYFDIKAHAMRPDRLQELMPGEKFDVILLCASLHELYYDSVVRFAMPEEFHAGVFTEIHARLIAPGGLLLVGDYAWPPSANVKDIWRIKDKQRDLTGHADPPWTFVGMGSLQKHAYDAGFRERSSIGVGLYDNQTDEQLAAMFGRDLIETARLRVGYVFTFAPESQRRYSAERPAATDAANTYQTSIALSVKADAAIMSVADDRRLWESKLNELFTDQTEAQTSSLSRLMKRIREIVDWTIGEHQILPPRAFEVWIGVGLQTLDRRFIPSIPCPWRGKSVRGGVLLADIDNSQDLVAGPATEPFLWLEEQSEAPSLHAWTGELHKLLNYRWREFAAGRVPHPEVTPFRSLSVILFRDGSSELLRDLEQSRSSIALLPLWTGLQKDGHFRCVLRESGDDSLAAQLDQFLREEVAAVVAGGDASLGLCDRVVRGRVVRASEADTDSRLRVYDAFLHAALRSSPTDGERNFQAEMYKDFDVWWRKAVHGGEPPRYDAFTTLAFGCDGVAASDPDTMVMFSEQALPPSALTEIALIVLDLFHGLSRSEDTFLRARKARAEERLVQQQQSLKSFGHDGKRPAITILRGLDQPWPEADRLALVRFVAASLWQRLGSYSALVGADDNRTIARQRLIADANDVRTSTLLSSIWRSEVISQLVRCLVDDGGWKTIRQGLWGDVDPVALWNRLRPAFEPILELNKYLRSSHETRTAAQVQAVDACTAALRDFNVRIDYIGPDIAIPEALLGSNGGPVEARLPVALGFILSEFLTNTFKHQYNEIPNRLASEGLSTRLAVTETANGFTLMTRFAPLNRHSTVRTDFSGDQRKTFTGLESLRSTIAAIGCTGHVEAITHRHATGEIVTEEFPYFSIEKDGMGHPAATVWTIEELIREALRHER